MELVAIHAAQLDRATVDSEHSALGRDGTEADAQVDSLRFGLNVAVVEVRFLGRPRTHSFAADLGPGRYLLDAEFRDGQPRRRTDDVDAKCSTRGDVVEPGVHEHV